MENASKALLIAGAILIAILLIAIGMMVFNSANGVITSSTSNMSQQEKTAFNQQFTVYEGTKSGSVVKQLVQLINTNNSQAENTKITIDGDAGVSAAKASDGSVSSANTSSLLNQAQYKVTFSDDQGVINACHINKAQ